MPLHRSLLFWCGSLVFAFLLWGWWDSMNSTSRLAWRSPSKVSEFVLSNSGAKVTLDQSYRADGLPDDPLLGDLPVVGRLFKRQHFSRSPAPEEARWLPWPAYAGKTTTNGFPAYDCGLGPQVDGVGIPDHIYISEFWELAHWLLIAGYLPLWLGLSFWRARRITKRDTLLEEQLAEAAQL